MADSARSTGRDKNARPRERIFIHLRAYSSAASGKKGKGKACAGISIRDVAAQKSLSSLYAARFREREEEVEECIKGKRVYTDSRSTTLAVHRGLGFIARERERERLPSPAAFV